MGPLPAAGFKGRQAGGNVIKSHPRGNRPEWMNRTGLMGVAFSVFLRRCAPHFVILN